MKDKRAVLCFIIMCIMQSNECKQDFTFHSQPANDLQTIFNPRPSGWLGADVATSISLGSDRYLWLWGDTLVGKLIKNDTVRLISEMPRNSLAEMSVSGSEPGPLHFHVKNVLPTDKNIGFFSSTNRSEWFWITQGIMIKSRLYLFGLRVTATGDGPFDFEVVATTIITIENPEVKPESWQYTIADLPAFFPKTHWASALVVDGDYLYVLGSDHVLHKGVLSRVSITELQTTHWMKSMEFYCEQSPSMQQGVWQPISKCDKLLSIAPKMPETSLHYHPYLKKWYIFHLEFFSTTINILLSDKIEGPYDQSYLLYKIPHPWNDVKAGIFCYAPKTHPEFARNPNEIVFSYMSNTLDVNDLADKTKVYVPQFVRVIILKS